MFVEFSEIPLDADAKEVEVQRVSPFPSLTTLELNDNSIEELYYNIPEGVTSVNLARNQLVGRRTPPRLSLAGCTGPVPSVLQGLALAVAVKAGGAVRAWGGLGAGRWGRLWTTPPLWSWC